MKSKAYSAVFPVILRTGESGTEILLHRRQNTGYQDGKWDISGSGHVDDGEHPAAAAVRECKEELGITVDAEDLTFIHLSHRNISKDGAVKHNYYDIYFLVEKYSGTPEIMEPEKSSELKWFDINGLPFDMIDCRRDAVKAYMEKRMYGELTERL